MTLSRKLSFLFPDMRQTALRFPVSLLCAVILLAMVVMSNHNWLKLDHDIEGRLFLTLVCGYFAAGGIRLFCESRDWSVAKEWPLAPVALAGLAGVIFLSPQWELHIVFLLPAILLFVLIAPFLNARTDDDAGFYRYGQALTLATIVGSFAGALLLAGMAAAVSSVNYLFELKLGDKIFSDLIAFCCILFTPFYALSWIPARMNAMESELDLPKAQRFILNWVLGPLVAVYFLILYAYALKIAVQWSLPQGQLAYMITGFGGVGIVTYLAAWPLRESGGKLIRFVFRWFFPALILPSLLMGLAIASRVAAYGVTEQRYIIVMTAVWFLATALLFAVKRDRLPLKFIPAFLAVLFVLGSFGPWGGVSVSARSQIGRLEAVLVKNGLLADGHIVNQGKDVSFTDRKKISSILDYLNDTKRFKKLHSWFAGTDVQWQETDDGYGRKYGPSTETLMKAMGQSYVNRWQSPENPESWSMREDLNRNAMDVRGYDFYVWSSLSGSSGMAKDKPAWQDDVRLPPGADWPATKLSLTGNILEVRTEGAEPLRFDLKAYALERREQEKAHPGLNDPIVHDARNKDMRGRLVITSMNVSMPGKDADDFFVTYANFVLLLAKP